MVLQKPLAKEWPAGSPSIASAKVQGGEGAHGGTSHGRGPERETR